METLSLPQATVFKNFGSVSLGWAFSEEQFMYFLKPVVSFGKLRFSYGTSGNDVGLSDFDYVGTIGWVQPDLN